MPLSNKMYSFSAMEKYLGCSEKYRLHYFTPPDILRPSTDNTATVTGNVCHPVLEEFYDLHQRRMPVPKVLEAYWRTRLIKDGVDTDCIEGLEWIRRIYVQLIARGTAGYTGPDPILTTAKAPTFAKDFAGLKKTTAWSAALAASGVAQQRAIIDSMAADAATEDLERQKLTTLKPKALPWDRVSLTDVYLESWALLKEYRDHLAGHFVHKMEFKISATDRKTDQMINPVRFPFRDHPFFTGYIDMITTDPQGRLYIIDTKTSKTVPKAAKVAQWEQLLLYAWAHYEVTKQAGSPRWPDFLGINHLRSGQLIVAPFNPEFIPAALKRAEQVIHAIESQMFIQQNPSSFHQNCMRDFGDEPACEWLSYCHPAYAQAMGVR